MHHINGPESLLTVYHKNVRNNRFTHQVLLRWSDVVSLKVKVFCFFSCFIFMYFFRRFGTCRNSTITAYMRSLLCVADVVVFFIFLFLSFRYRLLYFFFFGTLSIWIFFLCCRVSFFFLFILLLCGKHQPTDVDVIR